MKTIPVLRSSICWALGMLLTATAAGNAQETGLPPLPQLSETAQRVETLIDRQSPFLEPRPSVIPQVPRKGARLVGYWYWGGPLSHDALHIEGEPAGPFRVWFETGGCNAHWSLPRVATYRDGMLELDRPVRDYSGTTYRRLALIAEKGRVRLVPADRDRRAAALLPPARSSGSTKPQLGGFERQAKPASRAIAGSGGPALNSWETPAAPDELVPMNHWAYDSVTQLVQQGFVTGFPPHEFSGKKALPRVAFARAIPPLAASSLLVRRTGIPVERNCAVGLFRLILTFTPELVANGAKLGDLWDACYALDASRDRPVAGGLALPLPAGPVALEPQLMGLPVTEPARKGADQAAAEWARGVVQLYTLRSVPGPEDAYPRAIPMVVQPDTPGAADYVAGHNAEVWRRLRELGPPAGSPVSWLRDVFDLKRTWGRDGDGKRRRLKKTGEYPAGHGADGPTLLFRSGWHSHFGDPLLSVRLVSNGPVTSLRPVPSLGGHWPTQAEPVIRWGPAGTGVIYLRVSLKGESRICAFDIRTGWLLNAGEG